MEQLHHVLRDLPNEAIRRGAESISVTRKCSACGHDPDSSSGPANSCKISMLLNKNTIGACFISEDWKISSKGMFAGTCIAIALLAIFLELLRRGVKEYDRKILRDHIRKHKIEGGSSSESSTVASTEGFPATREEEKQRNSWTVGKSAKPGAIPPFRPTLLQQTARTLLHTALFVLAYFLMLIAMYYNVYVLVSIFLGILVGTFVFQNETVHFGNENLEKADPAICCG